MRILILSDVHANWTALRTVREEFDVCLCLGDLVDYGVEPAPCVEWAREHVTHGVRGNHDHGVAQRVRITGSGGFRYLTGITCSLNEQMLSPDQRRYLARLPITQQLTLDGKRILMVHATPRDPMDEYGPACPDFWAKRLENVSADFVLVGHTHRPYSIDVNGTRVINPGSIGLPRDGDPRLSYAVLDGDELTMKRVEYPVEEAVAAVEQSPLPAKAKTALTELYRTGKLASMPSQMRKPAEVVHAVGA